jgi:hypothetical protein
VEQDAFAENWKVFVGFVDIVKAEQKAFVEMMVVVDRIVDLLVTLVVVDIVVVEHIDHIQVVVVVVVVEHKNSWVVVVVVVDVVDTDHNLEQLVVVHVILVVQLEDVVQEVESNSVTKVMQGSSFE